MAEDNTATQEQPAVMPNLKDTFNNKQAPEDMAAAFFAMEQPKLKNLVDQMSLRQMKRVLFNLASYPFVRQENALNTELEKKAFYLAEQMVMNKTIMQLSLELQKAEEAAKKEEQDKTNETLIKGEQENG